MRNAWHFYYALVLVIKVVCGNIGIALAHPLTRRYVLGGNVEVSKGCGNFQCIPKTYSKYL
ncbi:DUF3265 domain-containing protein [Vibrio parahaemolyticus]|nr:DUF3265 domain-containing protein [Vibrio parahaemolyticus]EGQ8739624.1 DUF3265 domain-containing protein [Vibrio parahaemolyticus]EGQ8907628.1 DUF3265 domain-containing protein [Vibrio parahaemolyticus]EGR3101779.1 DUF3265 domain-containing protein [Vibrio parahaemolyticus]EHY0996590.1 DUF3265 domain-containing protein [Vibrio parahaemolyticus]